ncbi:MAG: LysR family transcriptional regulator [Gammaproteobacteria bacterium]|nr:LysR family transcriptional regulator [Gammaproteobacteria bacterium]RZV56072.1 MAG: LysR family transcriptional regulator [Pseudomonadales bacterium]
MSYTLRQIQIFLSVARHQSITRAADELHMSQSAASEALQNLQQAYGVTLFERKQNRMRLSAVGNTLRKDAEQLLSHSQVFEQRLLGHKSLGHIKVAASFTIGNHLATRYLSDYLAEFPEAEVDLLTANTPDVVEMVRDYAVDIGMIEHEVQDNDLFLSHWMRDEMVVFCAADHPLAKKRSLNAADIRGARWILREPGSGARQTFDSALAELLPDINVYLEFRHNEAIKNAVEAGLGIGCLSRIVLRKNFAIGDLVPLSMPRRALQRNFYFVLPRERYPNSSVDAWMRICRARQ